MQISHRLSNIKPSLTLSVNSRALELKAQGVSVTSLAVGEPDFPTPPHVCAAAKAAIDANFCHYTAVPGIPELRKAAGDYFGRAYGVPVPRESIIIGAGGKHCLYNFIQTTINPGDEVLLPAPYWLSYPDMVMLAEGVPVPVSAGPEQNFKVTPAMLEAHRTAKTRLLILNSPSNPTGAVYTEAEFTAIMDWALSQGIFVLSDEIYDQLVFSPATMTSAIGWFAEYPRQVAVLNGLSKSYAMTGWRVGFLAAHPDLIKKISSMQGHSTSNICSIAQKAALAALTGPMDGVREMCRAFQRRRDLAMHIIEDWPFAVCPRPDGAFYLFVDVRKCFGRLAANSTDICTRLLDKAHVAVVPGAAFGDDNCIRFSYAVADDVLAKALDRIGAELAVLAEAAQN
ncbi:pyridoxal phosphate-dependent aminotransferase [Desulfovibrio legallii]|uniref:Aminotransferase n=1 Tax=Desulfovibrio legallii TaxID=571438 RepID=A0A6H3FC83_9BACT|nr:pyridoxal phosphate-dependent aminotransferase [Desulfovibrio legallii]RHH24853.1 pyridoxal phosphate-dependent aminotransferase [Desulfovibrio sp. AM18-2]TBH80744.1 pyridoxal phosphate-dependent aminotransferase [Desulfovibrio legallii]CAI3238644.1 Aspartate aminotransferase (EC [Desulfovibrio diazotrophicus]